MGIRRARIGGRGESSGANEGSQMLEDRQGRGVFEQIVRLDDHHIAEQA